MPPCHPYTIFTSLLWEWGILLLLRIGRGISSECHHATPYTPLFGIVIIVVMGALCFCFDLAKVFLQSANMPPLHLFFELPLLWEGALFFCFDLGRVFLQGDTMPPLHYFLELSLVWERGIMLLLRLSQCIFQGATMPP